MRRAVTCVLVALHTWVAAGCFHYVPAEDVPPRGTAVRAHLAEPMSVDLEDVTAHSIVRLRGEVVVSEADRLVLSVFALESATDFEYLGRGATVAISKGGLAALEQKKISPVRTALATGAVLGTLYLIQLGLGNPLGGGGEGEGGGGAAN